MDCLTRIRLVCRYNDIIAITKRHIVKGNKIATKETTRINEAIKHPAIRLIGAEGEPLGILSSSQALEMAQELDLDLVEIAATANPPVCKIMNFSKYLYEQELKAKEAKHNQHKIEIKEIRFRPKIETHDYETKQNQIRKFLLAGDKVKIVVQFQGREQSRPELGYNIMEKLSTHFSELASIEFGPKHEGRNMIMILIPGAKKAH